MFGRGAISVMYGWALEKAGHRVEFYVRPGRAKELGKSLAVNIIDDRNKLKGVDQTWNITLREDIPEGHDYDLIILSVQHYKFKEASGFLAKRSGKATILIFNNFWNDPQLEAAELPPEQLVGAFQRQAEALIKTVNWRAHYSSRCISERLIQTQPKGNWT